MSVCQHFDESCPSRSLFDNIADKWSMMVISVLDAGPMRFNGIKRPIGGVTPKALTQCLRRLERNGLISRRIIETSPIGVEYTITPLGRSLLGPFQALHGWTLEHLDEVERARQAFDGRATA
jgi:DNA-binding HxlR family transcriptional regulator